MKIASFVCALILVSQLFADSPTSKPSADIKVFDATDTKGLTDAAGMTVIVKGEISRSFATKTVLLLNFKGVDRNGFCTAIKKDDQKAVNDGFGGDVSEKLKGKSVRVTGQIILYKEKPEIEVSKPEQIEIDSK